MPYKLDTNRNGGGAVTLVKEDIPSKRLAKHNFLGDVEDFFVELNLRKSKWLLFGFYPPPV